MKTLPSPVQAVVFDFDGVFTDNGVYVFEDGREAVKCSRFDGMGITLLRKAGLPMCVLSQEANPVVQRRCDKLKIECMQGVQTKLEVLRSWCAKKGVSMAGVVYVGNDVNDLECLEAAGYAVTPSDAHRKALAVADLVLSKPGGAGAVREICDLVLDQLAR